MMMVVGGLDELEGAGRVRVERSRSGSLVFAPIR
jgi:hypothetical protein